MELKIILICQLLWSTKTRQSIFVCQILTDFNTFCNAVTENKCEKIKHITYKVHNILLRHCLIAMYTD